MDLFQLVTPLMFKSSTQTGVGIQFEKALLNPTLCKDMHLWGVGGSGNSRSLAQPPQNTVEAKDQEIKLPVFLLECRLTDGIMGSNVFACKHETGSQILESKRNHLKYNISNMLT
jgi:hypothetical protein